jgi:hypothetical protein
MPIYDRPTKSLMADWAKDNLKPDQVFSKSDVVPWFAQHYPKITPAGFLCDPRHCEPGHCPA